MTTYWTFERDGEIFDADFNSMKEALSWADDAFAEQCQEEGPANGEEFEEDIVLIEYTYDDDGERVEKRRVPGVVSYEHYHGDLAEHGTWNSGGGGVL